MAVFALQSCVRSVTMPIMAAALSRPSTWKSPAFTALSTQIQHRNLFLNWLNSVFNRVDSSRIEEVGPDRACAEWLLRNGALVQWVGATEYVSQYNDLPLSADDKGKYFIKSVDATESSIMGLGFPHFEGCNHIEKILLQKCGYLNDDALPRLSPLKNSLRILEIIHCCNLTPEALLSLTSLKNLSSLKLAGFSEFKNQADIQQKLKHALPNCEICFE